jgi:phthalate 4,5-dioxygenase oxygenase subunit
VLTREDNELLCRVGPGTPMGEMLREYWIPALRSEALEADGAPVRVRLMGENFVAFRATDGRVGLFDEGCPHRCTSLALARNEDNALTCIFHGWKIDVTGKVVDVPSEPPERRAEFAAKVRVRHYPVREAGTIIWVYLGKREQPPRFTDFEFTRVAAGRVRARVAVMHANWVQGMEAALDSAHAGILHRGWLDSSRPQRSVAITLAGRNNGPVFEFMQKPYGFREGALRQLADGTRYIRVREVAMPFYSIIPTEPRTPCFMTIAIPVDDEWTAQWYVHWDAERELPRELTEEDWVVQGTSGNLDNFCDQMGTIDTLWHQDRRAMKEGHWSGITRNGPYEDFIVEEAMGPIVDRTREYLGSSDSVIIRVRRMLLQAAREHQRGSNAPWLEAAADYSRLRGLAVRVPGQTDWRKLDPFDPPPEVEEPATSER